MIIRIHLDGGLDEAVDIHSRVDLLALEHRATKTFHARGVDQDDPAIQVEGEAERIGRHGLGTVLVAVGGLSHLDVGIAMVGAADNVGSVSPEEVEVHPCPRATGAGSPEAGYQEPGEPRRASTVGPWVA